MRDPLGNSVAVGQIVKCNYRVVSINEGSEAVTLRRLNYRCEPSVDATTVVATRPDFIIESGPPMEVIPPPGVATAGELVGNAPASPSPQAPAAAAQVGPGSGRRR